MKSNIITHYMEPHTEEWFAFRKNGIGGSEVTAAMGLDKHYSKARLYHEKVGDADPYKKDNESMFWGRVQEPIIAEMWQYFDGSNDGYIENFKNKKIVRKCRNLNGYVVNPKYPWLFASVDRLINIEGGFNLITGEPLKKEGILECKNTSYWASQAWEDGIPERYIYQVMQYMLVFESDYAEIVMLKGGNELYVEKLEFDPVLAQKMVNITKEFWYDQVLPGKEAFEKRIQYENIGDIGQMEQCDYIIQELEPEPDNTDDYATFKSERFMKERDKIIGTFEMMDIAKRHKFLKSVINHCESERNLCKNKFIKFLTDKNGDTIDFGQQGNVSWSERKGSKNRTLYNNYKEKPTDERIEEEFNKLNFEY